MRASELIGKEVRDREGIPLGVVTDLRCVQDGPPRGPMAALRVDGLMVSRHQTGALLGYGEDRRQGPWLLRTIVRALHRDGRTIPWEQVVRYDGEAVELRLRGHDLGIRPRRRTVRR